MPGIEEIGKAIEARVKDANAMSYAIWNIGITSSPEQCFKFHNYPAHFKCWKADSPAEALLIKQGFLDKGMKEAMGQDEALADCVFIF